MTKTKKLWIAAGVVCSLLAAAAILILPPLMGSSNRTKSNLTRAQIEYLAGKVSIHALDNKRFPPQARGLAALVDEKQIQADMLNDPWGKALVYACKDPACAVLSIYSIGANGIDEQGKGDDIGETLTLDAVLKPLMR